MDFVHSMTENYSKCLNLCYRPYSLTGIFQESFLTEWKNETGAEDAFKPLLFREG